MGEEDEDNPRNPSSKGSIPRAHPPRTTPKPQPNEPGPRRPRPGRAQRQQRRNVAESSAPTTMGPSTSTTLNPAAPDFVPGQQVFVTPASVVVAEQTSTSGRSNRGRPRGGRRGKHPEIKNGNEIEDGRVQVESVGTSLRPTGRPRKNENAKLRVQPKIIKESEDLMLRMTETLTKGEYDCSICTDSVFYPRYAFAYL
jgi:hypothetical protein